MGWKSLYTIGRTISPSWSPFSLERVSELVLATIDSNCAHFQMCRRSLQLPAVIMTFVYLTLALLGACSTCSAWGMGLYPGPSSQSNFTRWYSEYQAWVTSTRAQNGLNGDIYSVLQLKWTQVSTICLFVYKYLFQHSPILRRRASCSRKCTRTTCSCLTPPASSILLTGSLFTLIISVLMSWRHGIAA